MLLDKNIDLIGMAVAVYYESTPAGYGSDRPWYEPLPREDVVGHRGIVIEEDAGNLYMDYVNGRRCKCWVSHWYFNNEEYDVVHGPGAALKLVDRLARRRPRKQIMLTGSTLKQVRQKIQDSIPLGSRLLREEVINDGAARTMECTAASSDYALQKARMVIPRGAEVVHEETHENRTRHTIRVQEFDEETAKRNAFSAIPTNARLERTTLIERGKKGFLGVGRKPNTYVMCYSLSVFVAKVTFREAASLQITYEEENRAEEADTDFTRTVIVEADAHKPATGVGRNVMVDPAIHRDRFVDNSDGTVTDTDTGLMWQKEDDGQLRPFADARHYCCDLNLGDHRDWRLPTIDELRSVSSHWKQLFDKPKEDEPYWSSTILENPHWSSDKREGERYAAKVLFSSGAGNQYFLYYEYYTRAVRDIAVGHRPTPQGTA